MPINEKHNQSFLGLHAFFCAAWHYKFSRAWHQLHVFLRLVPVTSFPALGTRYKFSRAWHWLYVFLRLTPVVCFAGQALIGWFCYSHLLWSDGSDHFGLRQWSKKKNQNRLFFAAFFSSVTYCCQQNALAFVTNNHCSNCIFACIESVRCTQCLEAVTGRCTQMSRKFSSLYWKICSQTPS